MHTRNLMSVLVLLAVTLTATGAVAQPPYADLANREIKALGVEEIAGLEAGRGLGFALSAELNGWPGPKHVLELAEMLGLDPATRERVEAIRQEMAREAQRLGAEIVALERDIDRIFATANTPAEAEAAAPLVARAGTLRGELRWVHLKAHLATRPLLNAEQLAHYERARTHQAVGGAHAHHGH
jgi:hypothetical protein